MLATPFRIRAEVRHIGRAVAGCTQEAAAQPARAGAHPRAPFATRAATCRRRGNSRQWRISQGENVTHTKGHIGPGMSLVVRSFYD